MKKIQIFIGFQISFTMNEQEMVQFKQFQEYKQMANINCTGQEEFNQFLLYKKQQEDFLVSSSLAQTNLLNNSMLITTENNFASIASSSRTSSVSSNAFNTPPPPPAPTEEKCSSSAEVTKTLNAIKISKKRKKQPVMENYDAVASHHFRIPKIHFKQVEFLAYLRNKLSQFVMESEISTTFVSLKRFRDDYIIPLTKHFVGETDIELKNLKLSEEEFNLTEFSNMYTKLFVEGVHVKRQQRFKGLKAKPDAPERDMYRRFIGNLWEKLGIIDQYYSYYYYY